MDKQLYDWDSPQAEQQTQHSAVQTVVSSGSSEHLLAPCFHVCWFTEQLQQSTASRFSNISCNASPDLCWDILLACACLLALRSYLQLTNLINADTLQERAYRGGRQKSC